MTHLPAISGEDCSKALAKLGFYLRRQHGSHLILRRDQPLTQIVVPNHKELDRETSARYIDRSHSKTYT